MGKCFVKLPKFKVESQLSLKTVLHKLGVKDAFDGCADFSRLSQTKMFVTDVVHKVGWAGVGGHCGWMSVGRERKPLAPQPQSPLTPPPLLTFLRCAML